VLPAKSEFVRLVFELDAGIFLVRRGEGVHGVFQQQISITMHIEELDLKKKPDMFKNFG